MHISLLISWTDCYSGGDEFYSDINHSDGGFAAVMLPVDISSFLAEQETVAVR